MNLSKKIAPLFLLLITCAPLWYLLFFQFKQAQVQQNVKEKLEKQKLQTVIIEKEKVHWIKKGKEINIDGRMFDIKFCKEENGIYSFTGIYDEEETELNNNLKDVWEHHSETKHKNIVRLFQLLQTIFSNISEDILSLNFHPAISYVHAASSDLVDVFIMVLTPPPQVINSIIIKKH